MTRSVQIVVVTGKGGVGKTTTAAATAVRCAELGHRTLAVSTDPAHSLADAFGEPLGDRPRTIAPNLDAQQLDARQRLEEGWADLRAYLSEVLRWAGLAAVEAEELSVLPGLDELFALTDLAAHARSGTYDVIVVDCAPTAETLRLLSLPAALSWWHERVMGLGRQVTRVVGPVVHQLAGVPIADDGVFASADRLVSTLAGVRDLLTDPERTRVRLVCTPEQVVVAETRRALTHLALFGYALDAVVVNRVLPDAVTDPWFEPMRAAQQAVLAEVEPAFAPVPVLTSRLRPDEPVGIAALSVMAHDLFGDRDPSAAHHVGRVLTVTDGPDGTMVLVLDLPFADRTDLRLVRKRDELIVTLGPSRRAVLLPDALARRTVVDAELADGSLRVTFAAAGR